MNISFEITQMKQIFFITYQKFIKRGQPLNKFVVLNFLLKYNNKVNARTFTITCKHWSVYRFISDKYYFE